MVKLKRIDLLVIYGTPFIIIFISFLLYFSSLLETHPELSMGITYDLMFTSPLIYFLLIRKKAIPKITVLSVFIIGFIITKIIIPTQYNFHLILIETYFLPFLELFILSFIGFKVFKTIQSFKQNAQEEKDFYTVLKKSCLEILGYPKLASLFASEISMFYYSFFTWKKAEYRSNEFSNFKENSVFATYGAILLILLVESIVMHILLHSLSPLVAWIITGSSIYFAIQVFSQIKALRLRKTIITHNSLILRYGLFAEVVVPLSMIEKIEMTSQDILIEDKKIEKLALMKDLEFHNIILYFKKSQTLEVIYGIKKSCDVLLLHIDNKEVFYDMVVKNQNSLSI